VQSESVDELVDDDGRGGLAVDEGAGGVVRGRTPDDDDEAERRPPPKEEEEDDAAAKEEDWGAFGEAAKVDRRLLRAVSELKWSRPTLVQKAAIPVALTSGRDVLIHARTGSGKTACYAVPVLHGILQFKNEKFGTAEGAKGGAVSAVVLAPTRELVAQARRHLLSLASYCLDEIAVAALSGQDARADAEYLGPPPRGGADDEDSRDDNNKDSSSTQRADVVVATPAAFKEAVDARGGCADVAATVRFLVIDEADLVLSFGYDDDVSAILAWFSTTSLQKYLLSATLNEDVATLKKAALRRAATVKLKEDAGVFGGDRDDEAGLAQYFVALRKNKSDKFLVVYVMLKLALLDGRGILFVNDLDACYRLKLFLDLFSIRAVVLNAELPLASRLHAIESYNRGFYDLLVATDAAVLTNAWAPAEDDDDQQEAHDSDSDDDDSDDDDENPFGEPPPPQQEQQTSLPLLRATRDILEGHDTVAFADAPPDLAPLFAAASDTVISGDLEFDRLMFDRAIDAKDWIRAKLAAHRLLADKHDAPPAHLVDMRHRVARSTVATADDRRAFERAFADADWTMADLLGSQILHFQDDAPAPLVDV